MLWNLYAACFDLVAGLAPYQDMLDEVVTTLDLQPGMRVLNAGCGTGALEARLAQRHPEVELVAVDVSPAMLRQTKTVGRLASQVVGKRVCQSLNAATEPKLDPMSGTSRGGCISGLRSSSR